MVGLNQLFLTFHDSFSLQKKSFLPLFLKTDHQTPMSVVRLIFLWSIGVFCEQFCDQRRLCLTFTHLFHKCAVAYSSHLSHYAIRIILNILQHLGALKLPWGTAATRLRTSLYYNVSNTCIIFRCFASQLWSISLSCIHPYLFAVVMMTTYSSGVQCFAVTNFFLVSSGSCLPKHILLTYHYNILYFSSIFSHKTRFYLFFYLY